MAFRVGILPAAGKAQRFGGTLKELLPTKDGKSFLRHALDRLPVDLKVIVTTPEKLPFHAAEVKDAAFLFQQGERDFWSAIETALQVRADRYYFTMPDTYTSEAAFMKAYEDDFVLGTFKTRQPERFGVLSDGKIINKAIGLPKPSIAWGVLQWSSKVADFWRVEHPLNYTDAINMAMEKFGYRTYDIGLYIDNASLHEYLAYLIGE